MSSSPKTTDLQKFAAKLLPAATAGVHSRAFIAELILLALPPDTYGPEAISMAQELRGLEIVTEQAAIEELLYMGFDNDGYPVCEPLRSQLLAQLRTFDGGDEDESPLSWREREALNTCESIVWHNIYTTHNGQQGGARTTGHLPVFTVYGTDPEVNFQYYIHRLRISICA